ncbi:hypothetical protein [Haloarchaeobius sp. DFWS5]|uniref:hypothetical protein n=1 Tax=Haloarchaeobius sp. DFWS5 TaxID=3446114 RepID=UPI003EBC65EC
MPADEAESGRPGASNPQPPVDLPDDIVAALDAHADSPHIVREAILYAHELLNAHHESPTSIVPQGDEEILHVQERPGYTEVVKRNRPDSPDAYLYHVMREPHPSGETKLHWVVIGRVVADEYANESSEE